MKNNRPLGPAPATARRAPRLSPSRAALLETLRTRTLPTTLDALATLAGLHPNTVREHLDALVEGGFVTRFSAEPSGRGRPAWLYEATGTEPWTPPEYAGLASALAEAIHKRSPAPVGDALAAGRGWGRDLADQRGAVPEKTAAAARRKVVELFDDLGFAPEPNARSTSMRLTRCPLLDAATKYPDVVCGVHLGLAQGALDAYGADPGGADLLPFAEPGACRLHLAAGNRS